MNTDNVHLKIVAQNKKARRLYEILERYEAGIVLMGSEVKSVRAGRINFKDSYVTFIQNEAYLVDLNIAQYDNAGYLGHEPQRARKLLLHRRQIESLRGKVEQKGLTLIPLNFYLKDSLVKVEIALARGKKIHDRREELKQKAIARDLEREMSKSYK